jgi:hypothetical protein
MSNDKTFSLETDGATAMQRIVRGYVRFSRIFFTTTPLTEGYFRYLARKTVKEILKRAADEKMADNKAWAIMILQKVARGYIARNSIVR